MRIQMNPDVKQRWVAALRSGEYQQGRDQLVTSEGAYCCLGVLCDLAVKEGVIPSFLPGSTHPPVAVQEWAGVDESPDVPVGDGIEALVDLNDGGTSFAEIADLIEASL